MKERKDLTNHIAIIQSYFSNGNKDGCGVAFLDSDNNIVVKKSCENALKFWLNNYDKLRIITNMCIFHNRFAVGSEVNNENSHPFLNEKGDMALVHNGVLFNYSKVKKFLIKKGHKFSSDVDSEILLHSFEEWGYNFIKELRKFGVSGSATILIMKKDEILAYTNNNSLCIFELDN
ncbi:MAG: class II glutamine amidotransferase [Candidatus Micrarchaeia archaeon]